MAILCLTKLFACLNHEWLSVGVTMRNFGSMAVAVLLLLATTLIALQRTLLAGVAYGTVLLRFATMPWPSSAYSLSSPLLNDGQLLNDGLLNDNFAVAAAASRA